MSRHSPTWALSLLSAPYGLLGGVAFVTVPILLTAMHVTVAQQATIIAIATSPTIWGLLLSPLLDLRFSKRAYTLALGVLSPAMFSAALLAMHHLVLLTIFLTAAMLLGFLYESAAAGWTAQVSTPADYGAVSGWYNIVYLGTTGGFGGLGVWLVRMLPLSAAAALLSLSMVLPLLAAIALPSAPSLNVGTNHVFRTFFHSLLIGFRRKDFRFGLLVFFLPLCSFSFLFPSVGAQFQTSERWVTAITGPLSSLVCAIGCLVGVWALRQVSAIMAYVVPGLLAALLTILLIPAPKTFLLYSAGSLLYSLLNGVSFTAFRVVLFKTIGHDNPVAGTEASVLTAAANIPQRFLTAMNGIAFTHFGLNGMLADDSAWPIASGVLLLLLMRLAFAKKTASA